MNQSIAQLPKQAQPAQPTPRNNSFGSLYCSLRAMAIVVAHASTVQSHFIILYYRATTYFWAKELFSRVVSTIPERRTTGSLSRRWCVCVCVCVFVCVFVCVCVCVSVLRKKKQKENPSECRDPTHQYQSQ